MSYDGLVLRAVTLELHEKLCGSRIDKIYQPTKHELIFNLRQKGASYKLLLSSLAQEARVHLVTATAPNPSEPPLFCMVLRKHLEGGKILAVSQQDLERILEIECEVLDELGDKVLRKLIIEIMGKHSNIILIDPLQNKIIDALQRVPASLSRYRQVLPGLTYQSPPPQDKIIPWEATEKEFTRQMLELPLNLSISKALLKVSKGMSPQSIREIIYRTGLDEILPLEYCGEYELRRLWQELSRLGTELCSGHFFPEVISTKEDGLLTFSAIPLTSFSEDQRHCFSTMNEALDFYYLQKNKTDSLKQKKGVLAALIKKEIQRCEKKADLQQETIDEAENSAHLRLWGELLTANLHCLSQGTEAKVNNYYDPTGEAETIPLLPHLTVGENAQRYFARYQKSKKASVKAKEHLLETKRELDYLYSLLNSLDNVDSTTEIEEIKEEMRQTGYLKTTAKAKKKATQQPTQPQKLIQDSWLIYFGKNNRQNDLLTMKMAKSSDLWFHTKDIPGSHVVIKNPNDQTIPPEIIKKAALLAAFHSQARYSVNVPVDYTKKQNVWKPQGAKPGFVLYKNQHTVSVTPDPEKIKELLSEV